MTNKLGDMQGATPTPYRSLVGVHVLVATDSIDEREMFADVFQVYGAKVTCVASTVAALVSIRATRPNVIVYDLALSVDGGNGLMRELRSWSSAEGRETPVVALASCGDVAYIADDAHGAIFECTFTKPVGIATIVATLGDLASVPPGGGARANEPGARERGPRRRLLNPTAGPVATPNWTAKAE